MSKRKKSPAFPFYASDWLGSTKRAMMTAEQRAGYIDLLCHQWSHETCSLPDDDEILAKQRPDNLVPNSKEPLRPASF